MKLRAILSALTSLALATSVCACDGANSSSGNYSGEAAPAGAADAAALAESAPAAVASPISVKVSGSFDINKDNSQLVGTEGSITFDHFPQSLQEFEAVLPTLKQTPQGAVVAQLMAMELYRNNRADGEKAFKLCNVTSNVRMIMERVPDLFGYAGTKYGGDGYARPYQVASFLQGANRDNGYNPKRPYTVKMKVSANGAVYSDTFQTKVLYLQVATSGTDAGYRGCEVINTKKPGEPSGWIVFNCPGLYTQCKEIGFDSTFQGLP